MPVQPDQPGGSQGAVISRTAPCLLPEMSHVSALLLPTITLINWILPSILPHKSHLGNWRNAGEHHQPCRRCHSRCSQTDSATSPCWKPSCHLSLTLVVQLIQLTDAWV